MIALPGHGFVMLSMPKCASTTLVTSLMGRAEVMMRINPRLKHMNARTFTNRMAPVLQTGGYQRDDYELVSLFREPVAWLESWWRYRQRPALQDDDNSRAANSTADVSFDAFVGAYLDGAPGALKGRQARFIALSADLDIAVDRLFALERPDVWEGWIAEKIGEPLEVTMKNWSTSTSRPDLSRALRRRLEDHLRPELEIYEHLRAEGQWAPPRGHVPGR
ncbi:MULTISPECIES: hypothetical protein [Nocardioides]|uniref:Sulfotransferase family protein n=1 Tax=Nocardioides kribbensis TaxID=305517 RepID=A0ABV1NV12_9ACTN|nr:MULTISPECIES: hypothetical protein [unclassified Nocardioides]KQP64786.1 hypothetical protein ASF47_12900 [Nocardioides sp. Leaf285]KQQ43800.1 hypothetical protein ASF50_07945 [Nocardioides sp. Leaf307]MCM3515398.1 sulfotransferase family protein [Nocardioides sp. P86]